MTAIDVLVDGSGRLGPLAYDVPSGVTAGPGDAVRVPFGKQTRDGLVLGPAQDPSKATRSILERLGSRCSPTDLAVAEALAERSLSSLPAIAGRLSPASGRGAAALSVGPVSLVSVVHDVPSLPARGARARLYLRAPLVSPARLAAVEAARLSVRGQVLVLCPSVHLLEAVLAEFTSGAARLDSKARAGAWRGWREGQVPIGIGTRSAALYSCASLSGIVVVEEEHPGHVEQSAPYTHARDVAAARAAAHGGSLSLISANPSGAGMGVRGIKVLPVGDSREWPSVRLIDRSVAAPHDRLVPPQLRKLLSAAARDGVPVAALAESRPARRACARCFDARPCVQCSVSGCTHQEPSGCPRCGAVGVRWLGWDVARLAALLPGVEPLVFSNLVPWREAKAAFPAPVRDGRVVIVFDADPLLTSSSLEPEFVSLQVLLRAAEAAGPAGTLVVVSSVATPKVLAAVARRDQVVASKLVWANARTQSLPPFGRLVTVRVNWEKPPSTDRWPGVVFGPRRVGNEWEVLVSCTESDLPAVDDVVTRMRRRGKLRVWVR